MSIPQIGSTVSGPNGPNTILLEELIGSGYFGFVFKGLDQVKSLPYAVKFPQTNLPGINSKRLLAIKGEIAASTTIKHPNVVAVHHVETDPVPFLVMEFILGGTLQNRIDEYVAAGKLPEVGTLYDWITGLVDGISAINATMLHRDIKPDNILMDGNTPKIADFGLSKIVGVATRTDTFKGGQHVLYMAPEGWKLEPNNIQIDMYAMGITLYQAASLQFPYTIPTGAISGDAYRDMHFYQQPKPLTDYRNDMPIEFWHIIKRLMEKRADDRFANWQEVKEALDKAWSHQISSDAPDEIMSKVIEAAGDAHERFAQKQNEQARLEEEQHQRVKLDGYQHENLKTQIRNVVEEFNSLNHLANIRMVEPEPKVVTLFLPFSGHQTIEIRFFELEPAMKLKIGNVRVAGWVTAPGGIGFNLLLVRKDVEDLYGSWKVCHVNVNPRINGESRNQPFGFHHGEIVEKVERADRSGSGYTTSFSDDIRVAFLYLLHECFSKYSQ